MAIATLCDISIAAVEHGLLDRHTDLTLILAKGAGFSWETTRSIARFGNGGLPLAPAERDRLQSRYNTLKTETAKRVFRFLKVRGLSVATLPG